MKRDQFSSVIWLAIGIVIVYLSYRLGLGSSAHPGPGFLSFWSGVILCSLALLVFFRSQLSHLQEDIKISELWRALNWRKPISVLAALIVYGFVFTHAGFIISTSALLIFLFRSIDPIRWQTAILAAVLASVGSFIAFSLWLQVQLPYWVLEAFLFKMKRLLF